MNKLLMTLLAIIFATGPCFPQRKAALSFLCEIDNPSKDPNKLFRFIGCSQTKLVLQSRANNFVIYDLQNKKLSDYAKPKELKRINPSSFYCGDDSIFLAFTKNIFYSSISDINMLHNIRNHGEILGLRKSRSNLVLFYFDKIKVMDLSGKIIDSLALQSKLNFAGIPRLNSPYLSYYLTTQSKILVPYHFKHETQVKDFIVRNARKLDKYGIVFYPADYFDGYLPKTASEKEIFWNNIEEPSKILVTQINNYQDQKAIELDNGLINYSKVLPETIQVIDGSPASDDKGNSIKMLYNSGRIYLMFRAPDFSSRIHFFDADK